MSKQTLQKQECDRCGDDFERKQLRRQDGILVCKDCYDSPIKVKNRLPLFGSPRDHSDTTDPVVNKPIIFSLSSAGVTYISHSFSPTRESWRRYFEMHVKSTGGNVVLATIADSELGDRLTLKGTSDTDTVTLNEGTTVDLTYDLPVTLKNGDMISFVYVNDIDLGMKWGDPWDISQWGNVEYGSGWRETSRLSGGV